MSETNISAKSPLTVKFCGLQTEADIDAVNRVFSETAGRAPKYAGFICVPHRRRFVSLRQLAVLRKKLAPGVQAVGVFQNAPITQILESVQNGVIDLIQLHGEENPQYIHELRTALSGLRQNVIRENNIEEPAGIKIIQAFGIRGVEDIDEANHSVADYVLCDTFGGGTGKSFDWRLLAQMTRPYILAGGLNPGNVGKAVAQFAPCGVDTSGGIEKETGEKDVAKMLKFAFEALENSS